MENDKTIQEQAVVEKTDKGDKKKYFIGNSCNNYYCLSGYIFI